MPVGYSASTRVVGGYVNRLGSVFNRQSGFVTTLVVLTLLVVATLAMISAYELAQAAVIAAVYR